MLLKSVRFLCLLVAVIAYYGGRTEARAEMCNAICGEEADCFEPCDVGHEFGWYTTTCGEYDGGVQYGMCAYPTWDTCHFICTTDGSCSDECLNNGVPGVCGDIGVCLDYNDGICSPAENCQNSSDCLCNLNEPTELLSSISTSLSSYDVKTACEVMTSAPNNLFSPWVSPTDDGLAEPFSGVLCSQRETAINNELKKVYIYLIAVEIYGWTQFQDELNEAIDNYMDWQHLPCFLFAARR
jgi:hypothetical protein